MKGCLIRGWELTLLGFGGTSTLSRGETLPACWLYEPQPQRSVDGSEVYSSRGAVSTRAITVFVPGLLEL